MRSTLRARLGLETILINNYECAMILICAIIWTAARKKCRTLIQRGEKCCAFDYVILFRLSLSIIYTITGTRNETRVFAIHSPFDPFSNEAARRGRASASVVGPAGAIPRYQVKVCTAASFSTCRLSFLHFASRHIKIALFCLQRAKERKQTLTQEKEIPNANRERGNHNNEREQSYFGRL